LLFFVVLTTKLQIVDQKLQIVGQF